MDTPEKRKVVSISPDPRLMKRLEAWIAAQDIPPSKTAVIDKAIEEFLISRNH